MFLVSLDSSLAFSCADANNNNNNNKPVISGLPDWTVFVNTTAATAKWAFYAICVSAMKTNLSLNLLSSRRKISRLVLFHKLYHHSTLRNDFIFQPQYVSPRIDHRYKVGLESCHTKTFLQSFFLRSSTEWNHLPDEIVSIHDNQRFRASLANIV